MVRGSVYLVEITAWMRMLALAGIDGRWWELKRSRLPLVAIAARLATRSRRPWQRPSAHAPHVVAVTAGSGATWLRPRLATSNRGWLYPHGYRTQPANGIEAQPHDTGWFLSPGNRKNPKTGRQLTLQVHYALRAAGASAQMRTRVLLSWFNPC